MQKEIYKQKSNNVFKTWLYILLFSLLIGAIGFILASYFNNPLFLWIGSLFSIGTSIYSYWFSASLVLRMSGASEIKQEDNKDLFNLVRELSSKAGLPMPKVYIIEDPSPNAFATGRNPENGVVAFTTGILSLLDRDELAGVIAHELAHIANRDTLLMTVVSVFASLIQTAVSMLYYFSPSNGENKNPLVGIVIMLAISILAPLAASIIQLAISRKREFLADTTGAEITGYPNGLANALNKIHKFPVGMNNVNESISHLFISNPHKDNEVEHTPWYAKLFMTHPPVEERIKNLLG